MKKPLESEIKKQIAVELIEEYELSIARAYKLMGDPPFVLLLRRSEMTLKLKKRQGRQHTTETGSGRYSNVSGMKAGSGTTRKFTACTRICTTRNRFV